jgi:hypothetical protein
MQATHTVQTLAMHVGAASQVIIIHAQSAAACRYNQLKHCAVLTGVSHVQHTWDHMRFLHKQHVVYINTRSDTPTNGMHSPKLGSCHAKITTGNKQAHCQVSTFEWHVQVNP